MVIFYNNKTGEIFATIDGRVHTKKDLECYVMGDKMKPEDIGKHIIGWIDGDGSKIEYNMDEFPLLQEFESISQTSPLDYKVDIDTGKLIKRELDK